MAVFEFGITSSSHTQGPGERLLFCRRGNALIRGEGPARERQRQRERERETETDREKERKRETETETDRENYQRRDFKRTQTVNQQAERGLHPLISSLPHCP